MSNGNGSTFTLLRYGVAAAALAVIAHKYRELSREGHSFAKTDLTPTRSARKSGPPNQPLSGPFCEFYLNKDKLYIHWKKWVPVAGFHPKPKAILVIAHGLGEHIARYEEFAKEMLKLGIIVFGQDHQGHGRSEGDRLYIRKFSDYIDDILQLTEIAKTQYPGLDVYIMGHSMGGAIAIQTLLKSQNTFKGAILSAPALKEDPSVVGPFLKSVALVLGDILPRLPLDALNPNFISRNAQAVDQYMADPLVCNLPIPARLGSSMLNAFEDMQKRANEITIPYLLMHGTADRLTEYHGSEKFHSNTSSSDKVFRSYKGQYHEILVEPEQTAIKDIIEWFKSRL